MSKYYLNECVECEQPCIYENCPFYQVEHCCCDFCGRSDEDVKMIISNQILNQIILTYLGINSKI